MRPHEQTDSAWLEELKAYLAAYGRMPRLRSHPGATDQDRRLTSWLNRILYKDIDKTPEKKAVREEILAIKAGRDRWAAHYGELVEFRAEHGRLPGRSDKDPVSHWLADQRSAYRRGTLTPERAAQLRAVDGALPAEQLTGAQILDQAWHGFFTDLKTWARKNGRMPRRRSTDAEEYRLANWLNRQAVSYRAGKLSTGYAKKLKGLGAL